MKLSGFELVTVAALEQSATTVWLPGGRRSSELIAPAITDGWGRLPLTAGALSAEKDAGPPNGLESCTIMQRSPVVLRNQVPVARSFEHHLFPNRNTMRRGIDFCKSTESFVYGSE